jgi:hypothetical protein
MYDRIGKGFMMSVWRIVRPVNPFRPFVGRPLVGLRAFAVQTSLVPSLGAALLTAVWLLTVSAARGADEPEALNPFAPRPAERDDAVPGYVETSDGRVYPGLVYMTRDKRLKLMDESLQRQREIPLRVVKQIECKIKKEWVEKEWKFKELALDQKMYTGREYPSREYLHTITLDDDRTITGPLSEIVYVKPYMDKPEPGSKAYRPETDLQPQRFLLHKRDKGEIGTDLKSLKYVKVVKLGEAALEEGRRKAAGRPAEKSTRTSPKKTSSRKQPEKESSDDQ